MQYSTEQEVAERAARAAGEIVLSHYARGGIAVTTKADASPVTEADTAANAAIIDILRAAFPDDAILSEELPDDRGRLGRARVWIVDPLDGTRDFVARTDQFAVHVGLAVGGEVAVGAVYQPVTAALYTARLGAGAWCEQAGARRPLRVSDRSSPSALRIGVSRLNAASALARCLAAARLDQQTVAMGASTKHMALAEGGLDAVINLSAGEQEWDTCAPEIVIREAGGIVTDGDGRPFRYNQADTLHVRGSIASNGACHRSLVDIVGPYLGGPR